MWRSNDQGSEKSALSSKGERPSGSVAALEYDPVASLPQATAPTSSSNPTEITVEQQAAPLDLIPPDTLALSLDNDEATKFLARSKAQIEESKKSDSMSTLLSEFVPTEKKKPYAPLPNQPGSIAVLPDDMPVALPSLPTSKEKALFCLSKFYENLFPLLYEGVIPSADYTTKRVKGLIKFYMHLLRMADSTMKCCRKPDALHRQNCVIGPDRPGSLSPHGLLIGFMGVYDSLTNGELKKAGEKDKLFAAKAKLAALSLHYDVSIYVDHNLEFFKDKRGRFSDMTIAERVSLVSAYSKAFPASDRSLTTRLINKITGESPENSSAQIINKGQKSRLETQRADVVLSSAPVIETEESTQKFIPVAPEVVNALYHLSKFYEQIFLLLDSTKNNYPVKEMLEDSMKHYILLLYKAYPEITCCKHLENLSHTEACYKPQKEDARPTETIGNNVYKSVEDLLSETPCDLPDPFRDSSLTEQTPDWSPELVCAHNILIVLSELRKKLIGDTSISQNDRIQLVRDAHDEIKKAVLDPIPFHFPEFSLLLLEKFALFFRNKTLADTSERTNKENASLELAYLATFVTNTNAKPSFVTRLLDKIRSEHPIADDASPDPEPLAITLPPKELVPLFTSEAKIEEEKEQKTETLVHQVIAKENDLSFSQAIPFTESVSKDVSDEEEVAFEDARGGEAEADEFTSFTPTLVQPTPDIAALRKIADKERAHQKEVDEIARSLLAKPAPAPVTPTVTDTKESIKESTLSTREEEALYYLSKFYEKIFLLLSKTPEETLYNSDHNIEKLIKQLRESYAQLLHMAEPNLLCCLEPGKQHPEKCYLDEANLPHNLLVELAAVERALRDNKNLKTERDKFTFAFGKLAPLACFYSFKLERSFLGLDALVKFFDISKDKTLSKMTPQERASLVSTYNEIFTDEALRLVTTHLIDKIAGRTPAPTAPVESPPKKQIEEKTQIPVAERVQKITRHVASVASRSSIALAHYSSEEYKEEKNNFPSFVTRKEEALYYLSRCYENIYFLLLPEHMSPQDREPLLKELIKEYTHLLRVAYPDMACCSNPDVPLPHAESCIVAKDKSVFAHGLLMDFIALNTKLQTVDKGAISSTALKALTGLFTRYSVPVFFSTERRAFSTVFENNKTLSKPSEMTVEERANLVSAYDKAFPKDDTNPTLIDDVIGETIKKEPAPASISDFLAMTPNAHSPSEKKMETAPRPQSSSSSQSQIHLTTEQTSRVLLGIFYAHLFLLFDDRPKRLAATYHVCALTDAYKKLVSIIPLPQFDKSLLDALRSLSKSLLPEGDLSDEDAETQYKMVRAKLIALSKNFYFPLPLSLPEQAESSCVRFSRVLIEGVTYKLTTIETVTAQQIEELETNYNAAFSDSATSLHIIKLMEKINNHQSKTASFTFFIKEEAQKVELPESLTTEEKSLIHLGKFYSHLVIVFYCPTTIVLLYHVSSLKEEYSKLLELIPSEDRQLDNKLLGALECLEEDLQDNNFWKKNYANYAEQKSFVCRRLEELSQLYRFPLPLVGNFKLYTGSAVQAPPLVLFGNALLANGFTLDKQISFLRSNYSLAFKNTDDKQLFLIIDLMKKINKPPVKSQAFAEAEDERENTQLIVRQPMQKAVDENDIKPLFLLGRFYAALYQLFCELEDGTTQIEAVESLVDLLVTTYADILRRANSANPHKVKDVATQGVKSLLRHTLGPKIGGLVAQSVPGMGNNMQSDSLLEGLRTLRRQLDTSLPSYPLQYSCAQLQKLSETHKFPLPRLSAAAVDESDLVKFSRILATCLSASSFEALDEGMKREKYISLLSNYSSAFAGFSGCSLIKLITKIPKKIPKSFVGRIVAPAVLRITEESNEITTSVRSPEEKDWTEPGVTVVELVLPSIDGAAARLETVVDQTIAVVGSSEERKGFVTTSRFYNSFNQDLPSTRKQKAESEKTVEKPKESVPVVSDPQRETTDSDSKSDTDESKPPASSSSTQSSTSSVAAARSAPIELKKEEIPKLERKVPAKVSPPVSQQPTQEEYWSELERRVEETMPGIFGVVTLTERAVTLTQQAVARAKKGSGSSGEKSGLTAHANSSPPDDYGIHGNNLVKRVVPEKNRVSEKSENSDSENDSSSSEEEKKSVPGRKPKSAVKKKMEVIEVANPFQLASLPIDIDSENYGSVSDCSESSSESSSSNSEDFTSSSPQAASRHLVVVEEKKSAPPQTQLFTPPVAAPVFDLFSDLVEAGLLENVFAEEALRNQAAREQAAADQVARDRAQDQAWIDSLSRSLESSKDEIKGVLSELRAKPARTAKDIEDAREQISWIIIINDGTYQLTRNKMILKTLLAVTVIACVLLLTGLLPVTPIAIAGCAVAALAAVLFSAAASHIARKNKSYRFGLFQEAPDLDPEVNDKVANTILAPAVAV